MVGDIYCVNFINDKGSFFVLFVKSSNGIVVIILFFISIRIMSKFCVLKVLILFICFDIIYVVVNGVIIVDLIVNLIIELVLIDFLIVLYNLKEIVNFKEI